MILAFNDLRRWAKKYKLSQLYSLTNQQLRTLKCLDLSNKKLAKIPDSISSLKQLEELFLQNNELTTLPKGLGLLTHLETLRVHDNAITQESKQQFYKEIEQGDLGLIRVHFAKHFSYWGALLPRALITDRVRGEVGNKDESWPLDIRFLFAEDEKGLYLDYHFEERRAGESHNRVYENGDVQHLAVINPYRHCSDDPIENQRLIEEYVTENNRIAKLLESKGFGQEYPAEPSVRFSTNQHKTLWKSLCDLLQSRKECN